MFMLSIIQIMYAVIFVSFAWFVNPLSAPVLTLNFLMLNFGLIFCAYSGIGAFFRLLSKCWALEGMLFNDPQWLSMYRLKYCVRIAKKRLAFVPLLGIFWATKYPPSFLRDLNHHAEEMEEQYQFKQFVYELDSYNGPERGRELYELLDRFARLERITSLGTVIYLIKHVRMYLQWQIERFKRRIDDKAIDRDASYSAYIAVKNTDQSELFYKKYIDASSSVTTLLNRFATALDSMKQFQSNMFEVSLQYKQRGFYGDCLTYRTEAMSHLKNAIRRLDLQ